MFRFEHPSFLWMLALIPIFIIIFILVQRRQRKLLLNHISLEMLGKISPLRSKIRPSFKFLLLMVAFALLVLTLANPQLGTRMIKIKSKGSDIAICIDVSNSMMAEDTQPNRLERSKRAVSNLLDKLVSDRVSIIAFAGSAYIQMPLTSDYGAAKMFIEQMSCDLIATQGTAVGDAIDKAMESFGYNDPDQKWERNNRRAIIIFSDGENHEDDPVKNAEDAAKEGVKVFTIGIGTPSVTPIPIYYKGNMQGFKTDRNGHNVATSLDEETLRKIATAGNGTYAHVTNISSCLNAIVKELDKATLNETSFSEYRSAYLFTLSLALFCLLFDLIVFERKTIRYNNINDIFKKKRD